MYRRLIQKPGVALGAGLVMGLLVGVGMMFGALVTAAWRPPRQPDWGETLLHASTAQSSDAFAMATGMIDENSEGIYVLDFITGDLQCWVISPRTTQVYAAYRHNVARDLQTEGGKAPKYLMATGNITFLGGGRNTRLANSVVYVADSNTGVVATYAVPWDRTRATAGSAQGGPFVLLDRRKARNVTLRD